MNVCSPTSTLPAQVEYLIIWSSRQARRERRRYRIRAHRAQGGTWYYESLPVKVP